MRLSEFIRHSIDDVVDEWAEFARSNVPSAEHLGPEELGSYARKLLLHIADDIEARQSASDEYEKSRGKRPDNAPAVTESARQDADQRLRQGFSLMDVFAEYRALRANVVRRWTGQLAGADPGNLDELVRFNEAIDQAATESIKQYVSRVEESRNLLLGVLGHDLRNPLGAIRFSAEYLLRAEGLDTAGTKAVVRVKSSAGRMAQMVDDLLDFTRTRMGGSLPIEPASANLADVCRQAVEELEAFHPDRQIRMRCEGDMLGQWDVRRVAQLVSNLVANAVEHGRHGTPVTVSLTGEEHVVRVRVHNQGRVIAADARRTLFDPTMRPVVQEAERGEGSSGLGLGLYIVREVARAHGGQARVVSSDKAGTTFEVCLPRVVTRGVGLAKTRSATVS